MFDSLVWGLPGNRSVPNVKALSQNIVLCIWNTSAHMCHLIVSIDWLTTMINKLSPPTEGKTFLNMLKSPKLMIYVNFSS